MGWRNGRGKEDGCLAQKGVRLGGCGDVPYETRQILERGKAKGRRRWMDGWMWRDWTRQSGGRDRYTDRGRTNIPKHFFGCVFLYSKAFLFLHLRSMCERSSANSRCKRRNVFLFCRIYYLQNKISSQIHHAPPSFPFRRDTKSHFPRPRNDDA
jgi:hypothetical protein